ncbi:exonuclease domain-containing protein [Bacteroidota bacterium]
MFAVIDVETTGLRAQSERITEIAILIHDGEKIVEEFITLINPEKEIPFRIINLTGINNKMVADAPRFYEIAKKIVEMTEDKILVGHNVAFDYAFIRNEFRSLGYEFKRKTLCTAKLSRKLIPFRNSYSLSNLCKDLNVSINGRHRAAGDARATAVLFDILRSIDQNITEISLNGLNSKLRKEQIQNLPDKTGIYYFYNDKAEIIYIGKSNNIHERILSHLSNNTTKKALELKDQVADIDFEITGSELIALLKESDEIKKHMPLFNKSQRRTSFHYGLYSYTDSYGYKLLKLDRTDHNDIPLTSYTSLVEAKEHLFFLVEKFQLCQKLCGLFDTKGACFQYHVKTCNGACVQKESADLYNERVHKAVEMYNYSSNNFLIIDKGRTEMEKAIVKIENGKYLGYGYVNLEEINDNQANIQDYIQSYNDNRDVQQIIRSYLRQEKAEKIINL